eukprot:scaffold1875_cov339-Prasinococcus_capsulatus_cf.AAC.11
MRRITFSTGVRSSGSAATGMEGADAAELVLLRLLLPIVKAPCESTARRGSHSRRKFNPVKRRLSRAWKQLWLPRANGTQAKGPHAPVCPSKMAAGATLPAWRGQQLIRARCSGATLWDAPAILHCGARGQSPRRGRCGPHPPGAQKSWRLGRVRNFWGAA